MLCFELHQPFRLRQRLDDHKLSDIPTDKILETYFDYELTRDIFLRACRKSYLPATRQLLDLIHQSQRSNKPFKVGFSLSGSFIEQCEEFAQPVLEVFTRLAETDCVELLAETYYHSLAYYFQGSEEFSEQVRMHQDMVERRFGYHPKIFQNTEMIYSNGIAEKAEELGFSGIYTEGADRLFGPSKSPNFVYRPRGSHRIKLLLRNYQLTDDIAFRFSTRDWPGWPITADKYAQWLSDTPGDCINIFMDFETIGEHHWPSTGIFDFFKHLPERVSAYPHLNWATPIEAIQRHETAGEIDVPDSTPLSWADLERDTSAWLQNTMQLKSFERLRRLEPKLRRLGDPRLMKAWRYLQTSDHIYYMSTKGGGTGTVHSYFSPYGSPKDAYEAFERVVSDLEQRTGIALHSR